MKTNKTIVQRQNLLKHELLTVYIKVYNYRKVLSQAVCNSCTIELKKT